VEVECAAAPGALVAAVSPDRFLAAGARHPSVFQRGLLHGQQACSVRAWCLKVLIDWLAGLGCCVRCHLASLAAPGLCLRESRASTRVRDPCLRPGWDREVVLVRWLVCLGRRLARHVRGVSTLAGLAHDWSAVSSQQSAVSSQQSAVSSQSAAAQRSDGVAPSSWLCPVSLGSAAASPGPSMSSKVCLQACWLAVVCSGPPGVPDPKTPPPAQQLSVPSRVHAHPHHELV